MEKRERVMLALFFLLWMVVVGFITYRMGQASVVHYR